MTATVRAAAASGSAAILSALRPLLPPERDAAVSKQVMLPFARMRKLGMLKALRAATPPWPFPPSIIDVAARNGKLDVVQYLRGKEQGPVEWTAATCAAAARDGHMDVLTWLTANGCPYDRSTALKNIFEEEA